MQLSFAAAPLHVSATDPAKLPSEETVIVNVPDWPREIVSACVEDAIVKSVIVCTMAAELDATFGSLLTKVAVTECEPAAIAFVENCA